MSRLVITDVTPLAGTVFPGLSALVVKDVECAGRVIVPRAATRDGAVRRQTLREQVPGVLERFQQTPHGWPPSSVRSPAHSGRASARLLLALGIGASRHTMLWVLLKIPLPVLAVPRVLGISAGSLIGICQLRAEPGAKLCYAHGRTWNEHGRPPTAQFAASRVGKDLAAEPGWRRPP
jgi:hypothetical protein